MMKALLHCSIALLLVMVLYSASAAEVAEGFGLGYQVSYLETMSEDLTLDHALSGRGWITPEFGLEGDLHFGGQSAESDGHDIYDMTWYALALKGLYAPMVNENSRFYLGLELSYAMCSYDPESKSLPDEDCTALTVGPLFGAEWHFSEFPELGFHWQAGYRFTVADTEYDQEGHKSYEDSMTFMGFYSGVGAHYYFK
jgi:hypothetical protein